MMPYDGSGYGHSVYWHSKMKEIAKQNNELCACWKENEPKINFIGDREDFAVEIKCHNMCISSFQKTQAQFTEQFKTFYKT
jgi:hypothetical protein